MDFSTNESGHIAMNAAPSNVPTTMGYSAMLENFGVIVDFCAISSGDLGVASLQGKKVGD